MNKWILALLLALGGCATSYIDPPLPADHPANPAALEADPPRRSLTLALDAADPVGNAPAAAARGHAGHGSGDHPATPHPAPHPAPHAETGASGQEGAAPPAKTGPPGAAFACPMHPEVTAREPDLQCPRCGMKLVLRQGGKQP